MPKKRMETWLVLLVLAVGLIPAALLGRWTYINATATPLHLSAEDVPSVSDLAATERWASAVERGRQIIRTGLVEQNLPGISVAVGAAGEIVWAEGFGWADLETRVKVEPDTRFRIGTASTPLTSAAVGALLEQGKLRLDDDIRAYVPEFPQQHGPVTVRQVMAHVAGLRNDGGDEGPLLSQHCERPVDALQHFADRPLLFEPGTAYRYSSYGWILISAAIEAAAGEPFLTFMRKQIFEPTGMRHTSEDAVSDPDPDRATPYFPRFAADPGYGLHVMRDVDYSCYAGASVFLSTPSDLVRFAIAIQSGKLLQPTTVEVLQRSQRLASGEETGYGLGWDIEAAELRSGPTRWVGHDGLVLGGPVASLVIFPDRDLVVSVTSNISYADAEGLAVKIAQAFAE